MLTLHPGEILSEYLDLSSYAEGNFPLDEVSKDMDIDSKTLRALVRCEQSVTEEIANKLATYFETSVEFWINMQENYENAKPADEVETQELVVAEASSKATSVDTVRTLEYLVSPPSSLVKLTRVDQITAAGSKPLHRYIARHGGEEMATIIEFHRGELVNGEPIGIYNETLVSILKDRIAILQTELPCEQNEEILVLLDRVEDLLDGRESAKLKEA